MAKDLRKQVLSLLWRNKIEKLKNILKIRSIVEVEHAKPSISNREKEKAAAKEKDCMYKGNQIYHDSII